MKNVPRLSDWTTTRIRCKYACWSRWGVLRVVKQLKRNSRIVAADFPGGAVNGPQPCQQLFAALSKSLFLAVQEANRRGSLAQSWWRQAKVPIHSIQRSYGPVTRIDVSTMV